MGLNSYVMALGPYDPKIKEHLEYSADYYEHLNHSYVGMEHIVFTNLFRCPTTNTSQMLAVLLGTDADELGHHELLPASLREKADQLRIFCINELCEPPTDVDAMLALTKMHGWRFFFRRDI